MNNLSDELMKNYYEMLEKVNAWNNLQFGAKYNRPVKVTFKDLWRRHVIDEGHKHV
jgi:hypothetical protein